VAILDSGAERRTRTIAVLKPAKAHDERVVHAMQLLNSMLWAFKGALSASWIAAEPETADVIVLHRDDRRALIASWKSRGKLIVEIETGATAASTEPLLLVYPFSAGQVRALLERLDEQLNVVPTTATPDEWRFVETLRKMRARADGHTWVAARRSSVHVFWLQSNAGLYVAEPSTVEALRSGALNLRDLQLGEGPPPPGAASRRSGVELLWHAGYHASAQLADRLNTITAFQLVRWPNFASIRPAPTQIRIVAAMASGESRVGGIASRAGASEIEVVRTLNALAAADLIVASTADLDAQPKTWTPPTRPRKGFTTFLRDVRRHLGLGMLA
jgi:hypothetical protein